MSNKESIPESMEYATEEYWKSHPNKESWEEELFNEYGVEIPQKFIDKIREEGRQEGLYLRNDIYQSELIGIGKQEERQRIIQIIDSMIKGQPPANGMAVLALEVLKSKLQEKT